MHLQARIDLLILRRGLIGSPLFTSGLNLAQVHGSTNLVLQLQELYAQPFANVRSNMTVQEPCAGVLERVSTRGSPSKRGGGSIHVLTSI